jgi:hypothetical protein
MRPAGRLLKMLELEDEWTEFYEIWRGRCVIGVHSKLILFNFLQLAVSTCRMLEFMTWNHDDAITGGPVRIRVCVITAQG